MSYTTWSRVSSTATTTPVNHPVPPRRAAYFPSTLSPTARWLRISDFCCLRRACNEFFAVSASSIDSELSRLRDDASSAIAPGSFCAHGGFVFENVFDKVAIARCAAATRALTCVRSRCAEASSILAASLRSTAAALAARAAASSASIIISATQAGLINLETYRPGLIQVTST